ncbi:helix-turn-helix domain-containing protein [Haloarchaeobius iranensis]|uniref:HTH DNA binding domain-containing protein n=1 Tax=Haloarchaeobius iranensis TaxID=996166 RepID=A0A1G9TMY8_9EURY|nr:helix-turn-helix domain-containing protein [Haloarchaeobius iranensis]SDM48898.1 HTH DNA binding domain-containing protein [Haloarchaeobius iranensis]
MPRAELTLTVPDGVWIGDISRDHPEARFRILAALTDDDAGVGLAEVIATDLPPVITAIDADETVTELEILQADDGKALVQFETTTPFLLLPVQGSGVPLELPFTLENGKAEWEITAPQHRLSALAEQLDTFGIPYTVEQVSQRVEPERLLTDSQLRLLLAAVDCGYYDTPRECSLTELAERMGMAKSTASETLHRAEEAVVKRFVEDANEDVLLEH